MATIAAIQTVIALGIDMMVPALGQIAQGLGVVAGNERQWVLTAFVLAFGAAQIPYGIAADRFGRKPVLVVALSLYALGAFAAAAAPSFAALILARILQGIGGAGAQVVTVSVVRDCYAGRRMAQVNSFVFIVFLAAPIFAPSIGQLVLMVLPWPAIFWGLGLYGMFIAAWVAWRLPETQHKGDQRAVSWADFSAGLRFTLANRTSLGYTLGVMLLLGAWLGFINSAQQVFAVIFRVPHLFPAIFAAISVGMAVAALVNARLVERLGMRRLTHGAMLGFIAVSLLQAGLACAGADGLVKFALVQGGIMFCFGLLAGNCNAIAMEPMGHIAGTAAAVQGVIGTLGAASIGSLIGLGFDGTLRPIALGFCAAGASCLCVVLWSEGGRLFTARATKQALAADSAP